MKTISAKELRSLLFDIDNQEMSVRKLRNLLFEFGADYDQQFDIDLIASRINKTEEKRNR